MNLMLIAVIIKALLALVGFPILITLYLEKGKVVGASAWKRWVFKNQYFLLLVLILGLGIFLEVRTYQSSERQSAEEKPLQFIRANVYQTELNNYIPPSNLSNWENAKQQLLRKFDYAQYAWDRNDYKTALEALLELEAGRDKVGELQKVSSFVVNNDLGCALFKLRRNKGFDAFAHFKTAIDLADSPEHRSIVEENVKSLDEMVNTLD